MVENLSATVENLSELSHFTGKQLVKELLMKLPKYMRLQWGSFLIQNDVNRQNINAFAECVHSMDKIVSAVGVILQVLWKMKLKLLLKSPIALQEVSTESVEFAVMVKTRQKILPNLQKRTKRLVGS
jgi:hypothetical protein